MSDSEKILKELKIIRLFHNVNLLRQLDYLDPA